MSTISLLSLVGAVRIQAKTFVDRHPAARPRPRAPVMQEAVIVTVGGRDALLVRRAVLFWPGAAVIRCMPMHRQDKVKLEIRFPAGCSDDLIHRVLAAVPAGEIGGVIRCVTAPERRARRVG